MGRATRQSSRGPIRPKPVEKIELSEKHVKLRLVLVILFALIAAGAIAFGVYSFLAGDPGWREIEVASGQLHCGQDFTLMYRLGESGDSVRAEGRAVETLYSRACERAYQLFTVDQETEGVSGMAYLNARPNQEVEIDEALYKALSQIQDSGDRSLYLAPAYVGYDNLFSCTADSQTEDFDPYKNPDVAAECAEIAGFANDPDTVDLELLAGNRVRLKVSQEYLRWAEENGVTVFLDFYWLKNAFIADYLADTLAEAGFTHGYLMSFDGFVRNLDEGGESYALMVNDRAGETVYPAAVMEYNGPAAIVSLRNYGKGGVDDRRYYQYENGEIRTTFVDAADGLCRTSRNDLICYSHQSGCAQILLETIPLYVAEVFPEDGAEKLLEREIFSVYCEDGKILYTDPDAKFSRLYADESVSYSAEPLA